MAWTTCWPSMGAMTDLAALAALQPSSSTVKLLLLVFAIWFSWWRG